MTPDAKELLKTAYAIVDGIPDTAIRFGLPCSARGPSLDQETVCSPEGWLAQHPDFVARGLSLSPNGTAILFQGEGDANRPAAAMAQAFEIPLDEASRLFGPRSNFTMDEANPLSDKALWQQRMREMLTETTEEAVMAAVQDAIPETASTGMSADGSGAPTDGAGNGQDDATNESASALDGIDEIGDEPDLNDQDPKEIAETGSLDPHFAHKAPL